MTSYPGESTLTLYFTIFLSTNTLFPIAMACFFGTAQLGCLCVMFVPLFSWPEYLVFLAEVTAVTVPLSEWWGSDSHGGRGDSHPLIQRDRKEGIKGERIWGVRPHLPQLHLLGWLRCLFAAAQCMFVAAQCRRGTLSLHRRWWALAWLGEWL